MFWGGGVGFMFQMLGGGHVLHSPEEVKLSILGGIMFSSLQGLPGHCCRGHCHCCHRPPGGGPHPQPTQHSWTQKVIITHHWQLNTAEIKRLHQSNMAAPLLPPTMDVTPHWHVTPPLTCHPLAVQGEKTAVKYLGNVNYFYGYSKMKTEFISQKIASCVWNLVKRERSYGQLRFANIWDTAHLFTEETHGLIFEYPYK